MLLVVDTDDWEAEELHLTCVHCGLGIYAGGNKTFYDTLRKATAHVEECKKNKPKV